MAFLTVHPRDHSTGSSPFAANLPVSSAFGYVHQLLYAARVSQGLGVLHVLACDLVQSTADGCRGLVGQYAWAVAAGQPVDQVSHGVLSCPKQKGYFYFQKVLDVYYCCF